MKKAFFLAMVLFGVLSYSQTKQNKVKELISLSGIFPLSKEVEKDVISNYKKKYSHVPESAWEPIEKKISVDELVNKVVEIYGNKFSEKEIEQLLIFYKSDVGKKVIQNSPSIMTEIQNASNSWGVKVMEIINGDLEKMGYLQSPPPPSTNK
ncbi:hypothetical protein J3D55_001102 [Chryseobacterium ginsenosidimutans]|uniref:DUF2059 domain-containing protein n=1 Tax=Chryseobacterium ginsenosidimutans TaxID=687846 RepID=UPI002167846E|nr:DUF2059 domain-containing protein [Chryseobacterium ginsenosidimutans]MCS3868186.1 hypothetical protein [Chryseobacterium ginsenosidimutans]